MKRDIREKSKHVKIPLLSNLKLKSSITVRYMKHPVYKKIKFIYSAFRTKRIGFQIFPYLYKQLSYE